MPPVPGAKRLLLREGFAARIDHPCADRRILRPARNAAPAHPNELALAIVADADDRDVVRRSDVVVRIDVGRMRKTEREGNRCGTAVQLVPPANRQPAALEPLAESTNEVAGSNGDASTRRAVLATCSVSQ